MFVCVLVTAEREHAQEMMNQKKKKKKIAQAWTLKSEQSVCQTEVE